MAELDVITLDEGKDILNLRNTSMYDAELPGYITAVSQRLDRLCGPVVQRMVTDELHDGGFPNLFVEFFPVFSFDSVVEYDHAIATVLTPDTPFVSPINAYRRHAYTAISGLWSNHLSRVSSGYSDVFSRHVLVSYVPGRVSSTALVPELYKRSAGIMLQNLWRSQQDSTGRVDEFDVPLSAFPRFAIPNAVKEMLCEEIQEPEVLLA